MVKHFFKFISLFLSLYLCFPATCFADDSVFVWSSETKSLTNEVNSSFTNPINNINPSSIETATTNKLSLESGSAILIEQNTGKVLYEHNPHEKLRPASVTKVMTILLIMEAIDSGKLKYEDKITCSETASGMGGSQIWLDVREELTVDEMLKAICVVSANDCTVAMAEHLAGSESSFVQQMNAKAKALGMNDTTFKNCHGIDEDGHLTSSYDIALMSRELLTKHPSITKYTTIWMDSLRDGKSSLVNTNKLIRNYNGATGLKTGSTSLALFNLSASATRDNLSLIAVIMKSPSTAIRFSEAQKLLDYGFSNFEYKKLAAKGDFIKDIYVEKGNGSTVKALISDDSGVLIEKGNGNKVEQVIELADIVKAPISSGQILGSIKYILEGKEIGKVNIIAENEVNKYSFIDMIEAVYSDWFSLLRT